MPHVHVSKQHKTKAKGKVISNDKLTRLLLQHKVDNRLFTSIYDADPMRRIMIVREGLPASTMQAMSDEFAMTQARVFSTLGVPRATAMRQLRENATLSPEATERVVYVAGLVKTVENMIPAGDAKGFNAPRWIADWLEMPQPALDGKKPEDFLDTADGRAIVSRLLSKIETGAYA